MATYCYLWEFIVRPEREGEFSQLYGPSGAWVELFRTAPGYLDTRLLRDRARPHRFVTVDRWSSEEAFRRFRRDRAVDFDVVDARGESLTVVQRELGEFTEVA